MKTQCLYGGIDLHSNNSLVAILDETDKVVYQKRLPNCIDTLLEELTPYKEALQGVVVESTYNWYWLVDGLQANGYKMHLANTAGNQPYKGLKHTGDKEDAIWLARLLRLGILEQGHIYPKATRGLRELLRRRLILVRQQTMNVLGIQGTITRYENIKLSCNKLKQEDAYTLFDKIQDPHVRFAVESQLQVLHCIVDQVNCLEKQIMQELKEEPVFKDVQTLPGVGPILAMTIVLETGEIKRFADCGNYSSYCRCVESKRVSNAKKKGENNRKNGNCYLSWAFVEAANCAIRYYKPVQRFYQRKLAKTNRVVAIKAIANKLSKACYFILRDGTEFDMKKTFG